MSEDITTPEETKPELAVEPKVPAIKTPLAEWDGRMALTMTRYVTLSVLTVLATWLITAPKEIEEVAWKDWGMLLATAGVAACNAVGSVMNGDWSQGTKTNEDAK